ncbi:NADH-dependent alcohol dehydrogenase [Photorhabdus luminescens]|uniref:NADH-dependent alcohol dehydrogenase n=1 Tax=Photorhabdus akhurstii TaxID=171438 RepID=A0ABX8LSF0_9GAMM|nr:iron-containing alcohol dehydrogenase [Photorhabdus akhurstii]QXF33073.1 NADH-dependent alcohol dehydrogenase [Photorhabdus akhurstii]UJD74869.1 NADH-dependent alcohol dehydrogenase [Photorhabdus luminescens]
MRNFRYYNPTKIVFGKETISRLDSLVPRDARVLILYGGNSAEKTGTLDEVRSALVNRTVQEFGGIEANPTYETLMKAVELIRNSEVNFLLAVGGGSVIDGTKFVAAAVNFAGEPWRILEEGGSLVQSALPFGTVLTLPATGSEMNSSSVITNKAKQVKLDFMSSLVFPQFSIMDPTKTYTLPLRQVANGVVDAFAHIMEQYLTYPANGMVQDRFAEGLLQILIEIGPQAINASDNYEIRSNLMWVATLALNGLIGAGVPQDWSTHYIGHELTALYGIDHARTLAILLPATLKICRESKRVKLLQYGERVWGITSGDEEQRIDQAIAYTRGFFEDLGIQTHLSDYNLGVDDIDRVVKRLEAHGLTQLGENRDITLDISRQILQASL